MGFYDYIILGFYFVFMIGIGVMFRRFNRDISDYFRGGGTMLWWLVGASTTMGSLSVWSFTGAASKIYETGLIVLAIYACGWVGALIVFFFTCYRFRQMRVITSVEAIRRRYGAATEQFYVWIQVPFGIFHAGLGLNTVAVFISSVFGTNLVETLITVGAIIIFVAMIGGAWAVVSGDFVQMILMLLITSVVVVLCLRLPEVGGVSGLMTKLPPSHFEWTAVSRPGVVIFWLVALLVQTLLIYNDLSAGAARFMTVKNGAHARKAALMALVISFFIPIITFIPPLAAVVVFPHLATQFPTLKNPGEASYVAMCMKVLPHGLLGLMVSAMLAVSMANLDTGLNRNVGVFVKNFYSRILRPEATERELLLVAKLFTAGFGLVIILIGVTIALFRTANLFDLVLMLGALIGIPLIVPLALGLFIKRAPSWAGWSTALVGLIAASAVKWGIGARLYASVMGWDMASLNPHEIDDITFATTVCAVALIGSLWYLFTMQFTATDGPQARARIEAFFRDMNTPIDPIAEGIVYDDARQYRTIGVLCLIYGGAMLLGILIPNELQGRLCFLYIGGVMTFLGGILLLGARVSSRKAARNISPVVETVLPESSSV
jgi:SSS family solute:Na+ symporter